uniref:Uncharacterized protein n=1 Tax=Oryza brachyantha TaxID=4533 RepID=J3MDA5_ORYBR
KSSHSTSEITSSLSCFIPSLRDFSPAITADLYKSNHVRLILCSQVHRAPTIPERLK